MFDVTLLKTFSFGYKSAASFDDSVSKEWIVNSLTPRLLCDADLEAQCFSFSAYLQSNMIDRKHRAYVFLEVEDMKFLWFAACLGGI